ncbi:MAG: hypothetical protein FJX80_12455 [Bacteroidetes bacterium]|nr:hypothetical protein [Bacteroidota bacterium]
MIKNLQLNENEYSTAIKVEKPFKSVKLIAAEQNTGSSIEDVVPFIELTLLGPNCKFSFHANRIPGSTQFNCFDLLTTAKETNESPLLSFNELLIICNKDFYRDKFKIQLKIEHQ